ncbi:hypothetical protein [Thermoactinospora rubra]|uniref:hypothetical protein n=1 Tax=Thermoactinospora rubra TaxID=1088767 RepID=UPI00197DEC96|nr:hypothetical protein [Thermoactinospora rubra]
MIPFLGPLWVTLVLLPATSVGRYRFEVVRAQTLYAYCHLFAIWHALRRRVAAWVPSGGRGARRSPLVRTVSRVALAWLTLTTAAVWAGIAWRAPEYGWARYWALTGFAVAGTYIALPLIRDLWRFAR